METLGFIYFLIAQITTPIMKEKLKQIKRRSKMETNNSIRDNVVVKVVSAGIGGVVGIGAGKIAKKAIETVVDSALGDNIFVKVAAVVITGIVSTYVSNYVQNGIGDVVEVVDVGIKGVKEVVKQTKEAKQKDSKIVNAEIVLQN